ncbi:aminoglycoside phosphotransferase family protein [Nocardia yamanashiensis]|uniref:phosphotransferase enzyme family protein n=1 Tax=Nocardia yamanashiensis TaxID=209247 RepID=UPI001E6181EC|nr:aminoglycoside phosphotransferase family protein [Nocardia yamanashiensis]UGT43405.1 aminoglycoside phosphotransferase family protein [Nocardia yamanashiensis]
MNRPSTTATSADILARAAGVAGLNATGSSLIRDGSHAIYRVGGDIAARIGRPGTSDAAAREIAISRWLNSSGIPTVEPNPDLPQPIVIDARPVTWWRWIPDHRPATPAELGTMLRALHTLPIPSDPVLPPYDPFAGLRTRLAHADAIDAENRSWLLNHHDELEQAFSSTPARDSVRVIHGDAWQGNLLVPQQSGIPTLLDLDKVSVGNRAWDLVQLAVDYTDFERISADAYRTFVDAYGGYSLTTDPNFRLFADIQELRWVGFALDRAAADPSAAHQAIHRISCLRGDVAKPWTWSAL